MKDKQEDNHDDYEIISQEFADGFKNKKVPWGFNGLGYIVYKRTYSREMESGKLEEWPDTIRRCINGAQKIGAQYTQDEACRLFNYLFNLKCNFAGRMLWQLGTSTVDRFGLPSMCNCWGLTMHEPESFCFLFEHLMLGGGVGFSVKREHIHELPKIKTNVNIRHEYTKDAGFIVPDSREGWTELLRKVLDSFFRDGKSFSYSTILIRGSGESIKGFGGTASGPKILIEGIDKISKIFRTRENKKLRSVDVLDICNIIGSIVVAGNVRRSAELAAGDPDDYLYIRAKRWDIGNIPNHRAMSNNSIYADSYEHISDVVWEGYEGNGEPYGFVNIKLCQTNGRLGEKQNDNCEILNPCAEATLENSEPCDLAELYLNNIESPEELLDCAKLLYKTQKAVLTLPSISEQTMKVVRRNMRIGLGVTGICQSLNKIEWLDNCYKQLKQFDIEWSKKRGWNKSIKLTVVKPSGTLSLLAGSTPGIHPSYSKFYIRRVRMSSSDDLVKICEDLGYNLECVRHFDGSLNHDTVVVEFPCQCDGAVIASEMSAIQQLELVKKLQTIWADQAVSCTVYYKKDELSSIKNWLKANYEKSIKSVSFLLHQDHGFDQAPYSEIDENEYFSVIKHIKPLETQFEISLGEIETGGECSSGSCPIR